MTTPLETLLALAKANNLTVTSTTGGKHNPGSKHYRGHAIDIDHSGIDPAALMALLPPGYRMLDERVRPAGQAEWGGPHYHLEYTGAGGAVAVPDAGVPMMPNLPIGPIEIPQNPYTAGEQGYVPGNRADIIPTNEDLLNLVRGTFQQGAPYQGSAAPDLSASQQAAQVSNVGQANAYTPQASYVPPPQPGVLENLLQGAQSVYDSNVAAPSDLASVVGQGAGVAAPALAGGAIGSIFGPVGTAVGLGLGGALGENFRGYNQDIREGIETTPFQYLTRTAMGGTAALPILRGSNMLGTIAKNVALGAGIGAAGQTVEDIGTGHGFDMGRSLQSAGVSGILGGVTAPFGHAVDAPAGSFSLKKPNAPVPQAVMDAARARLGQNVARTQLPPGVKLDPRVGNMAALTELDNRMQALLNPQTVDDLPTVTQVHDAVQAVTETPTGPRPKSDGYFDPATINDPLQMDFDGRQAAFRGAKGMGFRRDQVQPVEVSKGKFRIHIRDTAPVQQKVVPTAPGKTTLGDVVAESLSKDNPAFDSLKAYDTLKSLGYEPKQITRERNTLNEGFQYSVEINGKAIRFGDESLSNFMKNEGVNSDTLAKGVNLRGGQQNIDNLLEMLPDSPAKTRFLEERVASAGKKADNALDGHYASVQQHADEMLARINKGATESDFYKLADEYYASPKMKEFLEIPEHQLIFEDAWGKLEQRVFGQDDLTPGAVEAPVRAQLDPRDAQTVRDVDVSQLTEGAPVLGGKFAGFDEFGKPVITRRGGLTRPGEARTAATLPEVEYLATQAPDLMDPETSQVVQQILQHVEAGQATDFAVNSKFGRSSQLAESLGADGSPVAFDRVSHIEFKPASQKVPAQLRVIGTNADGKPAIRILKEAGNPELGLTVKGSREPLDAHFPELLDPTKRALVSDAEIMNAGVVRKAAAGTPHESHPIVQRLDDVMRSNDTKDIQQAIRDIDRLPAEVKQALSVQSGCAK